MPVFERGSKRCVAEPKKGSPSSGDIDDSPEPLTQELKAKESVATPGSTNEQRLATNKPKHDKK